MNTLALIAALAARAGAQSYPLAPTSGFPERFAVAADAAPQDESGVASLPVGAVITVLPLPGHRLHGALIGPKGILPIASDGPWSRRLDAPGGYRLVFERERDEELSARLDLVAQPGR